MVYKLKPIFTDLFRCKILYEAMENRTAPSTSLLYQAIESWFFSSLMCMCLAKRPDSKKATFVVNVNDDKIMLFIAKWDFCETDSKRWQFLRWKFANLRKKKVWPILQPVSSGISSRPFGRLFYNTVWKQKTKRRSLSLDATFQIYCMCNICILNVLYISFFLVFFATYRHVLFSF